MRYIREILIKNKAVVIAYVFIGILISFITNYKINLFQKIIDDFTDGTLKITSIIIYGVILIIFYLLNYLDEYPAKKLENGIYLDFKILSLRKISRICYREYQSLGTGKLTQRIENGSEAGKNIIFDFWFCFIRQLLPTILFSLLFIWKINSSIVWLMVIGYLIIFIITHLLLKSLYQIKEKILCNEEKMNHYLVRGFMEMIIFRFEKRFFSEIRKASLARDEIVNSKVKMNLIHEAFFTIFALLVALLDIAVLVYAWYSNELSIGETVALISLIENAYTPIAIFNVLFVQYKLDKAAYKRFEKFLNLEDDLQLEQGDRVRNCRGNIVIEDLTFNYENTNIFDHLNLSIKEGEKIAFVGSSGSGKTTLIKLIIGLLKYSVGSIKIDDQELGKLNLNDLYDNISYLSQDVPVFDGTVKENIVFDKDINNTEIYEVLKKVQLYSTIIDLQNKIDTIIGEKGVILSGGERQRLALARLWFQKSNIVILDEVSSAMDNITEELVMNEVINHLINKTVITVTHRLNSVKNFDRIILFKDGKIVGQGTFEDLLNNNAYFIELYTANND